MSGFGNEMGALFGGEMVTSYAPNWTTSEWNTLMGDGGPPSRWTFDSDSLEDKSPVGIKEKAHVDDKNPPKVDDTKLNEIPGLTSDQSVQDAVTAATTGGNAINWESWTFGQLRAEAAALKPTEINKLAGNWTTHGANLKEISETFKDNVGSAIAGKWSGDSAKMAEAASKQVTKTSIYDFAASAEEISDRLKVLSAAFDTVQTKFKEFANHNLIEHVDDKNWHNLQEEVAKFNSEYHFDDTGHLRNRDGGYVNVDTAVDAKKRLQQSLDDYTAAVQAFDDTYAPAIAAVATNFPNLPPLPNMKFEAPTDPTGPGGPGGPGGTKPFVPGGGGNPSGIKPFDKSAFDKLNGNKPTDFDKLKPIDQKPIDQKDLTTDPTKDALDNLSDPVKSAMDTATNAAKDALGQAMDAAKNAAGQNPLGSEMGGPPEGVLGLGPQGLGGAGVGKGAGGAGGGVPLRGMPSGLPSGAPITPAAAKVSAATAGAGLGAGAGSPGAGAPAAGQRAGDQNGKGHQVNKALRRKKNGKDVMGDSEASVPVVGADEEAEQSESAKPEQPESRRRIPQRGTQTWQPDSGVQPGPARPARGQQFTPGRSE